MSVSLAKLKIHRNTALVQEFVLNDDLTTIGRAPNNSLILSEPIISRRHTQISREAEGYMLSDLDSFDGTYINGRKLQPRTPRLLANGDTINIGNFELQFCIKTEVPTQSRQPSSGESTTVVNQVSTTRGEESALLEQLVLRGRDSLTIGRDADNDVVIDYPVVSRFHAQIRLREGSFYLVDLNSSNGTFINGKQLKGKRVLRAGDVIRIGPCRLTLNVDETIIRQNEEGNLRLDAIHLNKVVSGGGKSTLVDALNGFRPATSGTVLVNGIDLYKNFNAYRADIGYVPQKDIVHMELTIEQALDYGGMSRLIRVFGCESRGAPGAEVQGGKREYAFSLTSAASVFWSDVESIFSPAPPLRKLLCRLHRSA